MNTITRVILIIASLGIVSGLLGSITSIILPTEFYTTINNIFGYLNSFNFILPINTINTLIKLSIGFYTGLLSFWGIKWIIKIIYK